MKDLQFDLSIETVLSLVVVAIFVVIGLSITRSVMYNLQAAEEIANRGSINAQEGLEMSVSYFDWGELSPSEQATKSSFLTNRLPAVVTLEFATSDWDPVNASDYLFLSWDYDNRTLAQNEGLLVNFTLTVAANIWGIDNFTFCIYLYSYEVLVS